MKLIHGNCIDIIPLLIEYGMRQECGGINCNNNPTAIILNENPVPDRVALCDSCLEKAKAGKIDVVWNKLRDSNGMLV